MLKGYTNRNAVELLESPGGKRIAHIDLRGNTVSIDQESGEWVHLRTIADSSQTGWVRGAELDIQPPTPPNAIGQLGRKMMQNAHRTFYTMSGGLDACAATLRQVCDLPGVPAAKNYPSVLPKHGYYEVHDGSFQADDIVVWPSYGSRPAGKKYGHAGVGFIQDDERWYVSYHNRMMQNLPLAKEPGGYRLFRRR